MTLLQSRLCEDVLERARGVISGVVPGVQDISAAPCWKLASHGATGFVGLEDHPLGNALALKEYPGAPYAVNVHVGQRSKGGCQPSSLK